MTEIRLKIEVNDIQEIYFRNDKRKYFFGPTTRRQSFYLLFAILIFPFFVMKTIGMEDDLYFIAGGMLFFWVIYDFWRVASPIIKWKKSVYTFLEKVKKTKVAMLSYNDIFFVHVQDSEQTKQNWTVIDRAVIMEDYIWLFSNTNFLLPAKSMTKTEFDNLSITVMNKVKNVEKVLSSEVI